MTTDRQLLTDEAEAWVGHEYEDRTFVVTEHDIRRFIYSTRENECAAPPTDARTAPPMFYVVLRTLPYQSVPLTDLGADGVGEDELPQMPVTQGMAGEIEIEFGRPVRAGETVTIRKKIIDLVEKAGRSGRFVIITFLTECHSESGELLVRERFGRILR